MRSEFIRLGPIAGVASEEARWYNSLMDDPTIEIYAAIGDDVPFYTLVDNFYSEVETDLVLRPMYRDDLTDAKQHLALFLIQRFGGHGAYGNSRGHPRLRMRHVTFVIGKEQASAWVTHMRSAINRTPEFAPYAEIMLTYFQSSADFLINKEDIPSIEIQSRADDIRSG